MEVAGQWRREWAGTAEYGKVTQGGVTRHVARAMEVLNASAPGARVRVMRAAYHSSAGPGLPAVSSLMHSSRRVISSGFNLLESPTTPLKPLEISSTPLDATPEFNTDTDNYKVTEPDDFEISEPSKWRSSSGSNSIRMPSEESSSTDNASIIDLDSRLHRSAIRKHSYDSENSDIPLSRKSSCRLSPLLDAPVVLSTLKYKSLLNGSNDWTNRRKSYSFEDTSPLNETISYSNDTLAMESSTDSGICKSSEIVNEPDDRSIDQKDKKYFDRHEGTFKDWLSKNRPTSSFYKAHHIKPRREHDVVVEEPSENGVALQSKGKVTITVPIKVETNGEYQYRKNQASEDGDRKVKKVGFCKTELHFAAETGMVNIIATDEKPPPSNDFRKRRSAFVPIHGNFEKPITLFGETVKDFSEIIPSEFSPTINNETGEIDENTAATKSILKNKIPKPKPYLLGENIVFGSSDDDVANKNGDRCFANKVPAAVSLINRQLQERRYSNESASTDTDIDIIKNNVFRTTNTGPQISDTLKVKRSAFELKDSNSTNDYIKESNTNFVKNKLRTLQMSPIPGRAKTRQLRDSDLTYFGVESPRQSIMETPKYMGRLQPEPSSIDDIFQSVKLIQKVSNSVCNSEAESEDAPEYQNISVKNNFAPLSTPRTRSKNDYCILDSKETKKLKPVIEQTNEERAHVNIESRRSRIRRQEDSTTFSTRSISAPPKTNVYTSIEIPRTQDICSQVLGKMSPSPRSKRSHIVEERTSEIKRTSTPKRALEIREVSEEKEPLYVNLSAEEKKIKNAIQRTDSVRRKIEAQKRPHVKVDTSSSKRTETAETRKSRSNCIHTRPENKERVKSASRADTDSVEKKENPLQKTTRVKRTEKLSTPDYPNDKIYNSSSPRRKSSSERTDDDYNNTQTSKTEHRSRSAQRRPTKEFSERIAEEESKQDDRKDSKHQTIIEETMDVKFRTGNLTKDRSGRKKESTKTPPRTNLKSDSTHHTTNSRGREKIAMDKFPNAKPDSKSLKRSEYVINYDDKNGTVSSIRKVSGSGTSKKKKAIRERDTDTPKENKMKNKASEKIALLQFPEHQWDPYEMSYADRKWKRKMHVQRTCQLL